MDDDVRALVARAMHHDEVAWEELYRRLYPRLLTFARRRLFANHFAEDAVSDTMVRALGGIASFTWQGAGFEAWVLAILRNVVYEHRRRLRREVPRAVLGEADTADNHAPEPLAAVVASEQQDVVRRAFRLLSPADQELLELRVVAGLNSEGVAQQVGRRPGAVRMAQSRALKRLAASLGDLGREG